MQTSSIRLHLMVYNSIVVLDDIMDAGSHLSMTLHVHNLHFFDLHFVHYGRCHCHSCRMCIIGCFKIR